MPNITLYIGRSLALLLCLVFGQSGSAKTSLALPPGAVETLSRVEDPGVYLVPQAAFSMDAAPVRRIEGWRLLRSWRAPAEAGPPLRVFQILRDDLVTRGFEATFLCDNDGCGGFDFRYGTEIAPAPEMEVDLTAFHFATLTREAEGSTGYLTLLVSQSPEAVFVQSIEIWPSGESRPETAPVAPLPVEAPSEESSPKVLHTPEETTLAGQLARTGHGVLEGLDFASGSPDLADRPFAVLETLAAYLEANPEARLEVVGHSDAVGSRDGNIALSQKRAASVVARLTSKFGIAPDRLRASGVGYLAPRATNASAEGRALNRRVEVVLLAP